VCKLLLGNLLLQRHGRRLHGGLPLLHRWRRQLLVHAGVLRLRLRLLALLLRLRLLLLVVWRRRLRLGVAPYGGTACNLWQAVHKEVSGLLCLGCE
jgi:hypothetical protein